MVIPLYSFCAESLQSVVNELSRVESEGEVGANPTAATSAGVNPVSWSALETCLDLSFFHPDTHRCPPLCFDFIPLFNILGPRWPRTLTSASVPLWSASRLHLICFDEPSDSKRPRLPLQMVGPIMSLQREGLQSLKHGSLWLFNSRTLSLAGTLITCSAKLSAPHITTLTPSPLPAHHPACK